MKDIMFFLLSVVLVSIFLPQLVNAAVGIPLISISPANTILNVGQNVTFTANIHSGTAPFTYLFTIANSTNNILLMSNAVGSVGNTSATFVFTTTKAGGSSAIQEIKTTSKPYFPELIPFIVLAKALESRIGLA